jgi:transposase
MPKNAVNIKDIQLGDREQLHIGVDDHKKSYHVAIWSAQRDCLMAYWAQPSSPKTLINKLLPIKEHIEQIVYEAGPCGFTLVRQLRGAGFPADVVSASHTPQSQVRKGKCDRLDCSTLARQSSKKNLHKIYVPTVQEELDRQVCRLRVHMMKNQRRAKQRIKGFLLQHGINEPPQLRYWSKQSLGQLRQLPIAEDLKYCLEVFVDDLEHIQQVIKQVVKKIKELSETERHREQMLFMRTVPGVGLITSMAQATEIAMPQRFKKPTQVAMFIGTSPSIRSSGETQHECGREMCGNQYLRPILVEAAWQWKARDAWAEAKYKQLLNNTGSSKKAIVALSRHLGIILWRIMLTKQPYQPKPVAQIQETRTLLPEAPMVSA